VGGLALVVASAVVATLVLTADSAATARLEPRAEPRADSFTESVARVSTETFDPSTTTTTAEATTTTEPAEDEDEDEGGGSELTSDTGGEPDASLTVIEERTVVASLLVFDQAEVPLIEVVEQLRFVPGIKAGAVDAKTQVLDTSVYGSLEPGGWMVFIGPFDTRADAGAYCREVVEVAPDCEPAIVDGFEDVDPATDVPPPPEPSPVGAVDATEPGLFAGTAGAASCDGAALVDALSRDEDVATAWAGVQGLERGDIRSYVDGLTAVNLRRDTVVVNHGLVDGTAEPFLSVLEAGTAVFIDNRGVPRARCTCGGPLLPPTADAVERVRDASGAGAFAGAGWDGFEPTAVVDVRGSEEPLDSITLVDELTGRTIDRPFATSGEEDLADGGTGCQGCPPPTTTTTAPPSVDFTTFDVEGAIGCAGCEIRGTLEFDHPTWGRSLFVVTVDGPSSHLYALDDRGAVVYSQFLEGFEVVEAPIKDDLEHLFMPFTSGAGGTLGTIVFAPVPDDLDDFSSLPLDPATAAFYGSNGSGTADLDGDGVLEIQVGMNDCVPDCASGSDTIITYRWDGSQYVQTA
jgi:hypothetical protein